MKRRLLHPLIVGLIMGLLCALLLVVLSNGYGHSESPQQRVIPAVRALHPTADVTTLVQTRLHSFGYTVVIDGDWGKQTRRVTALWQKANGLPQTGLPNAATLASLGKISFATSDPSPAVRSSPPVSPSPVGSESPCDEMSRYRQAAGLPEQFDAIGYRESRCRNDVTSSTGCCVGYLQVHTGNFTAPGYRDGIAACGVSQRSDILGNSDEQKHAQMCVAKVLYDVSGTSPWAL